MNQDSQYGDLKPSFRVAQGETDEWEVLNHQGAVCGRVRRDGHGDFSITRDFWDGKWVGSFGSRQEAAEHLCIVQCEVEYSTRR